MGGFNSGRQGGKKTTNQMNNLDIRRVQRAGRLKPGILCTWSWTRNIDSVSSINMYVGDDVVTLSYRITDQFGESRNYSYPVMIEWTPCNYGGQRAWWVCPDCGRRVAVLFGGRRYACRHCHDLAYKSTRTAPGSECYGRANKIREKLGWGGGVASPQGNKPKWMHLKTYLRLLKQLTAHCIEASADMDATNDRIQEKLRGIGLSMRS
ncbi:MAG: hypothetical protein WCJ49_05885 [Deltaproteobacteria bacterium]